MDKKTQNFEELDMQEYLEKKYLNKSYSRKFDFKDSKEGCELEYELPKDPVKESFSKIYTAIFVIGFIILTLTT